MKILVLNSGSSSQKASLYEIAGAPAEDPASPLWEGRIEWEGNRASVRASTPSGPRWQKEIEGASREDVTRQLLEDLWSGGSLLRAPSEIDIVGHRIVHGGERFSEPVHVTPDVKNAIRRTSEFAPLHNPAGLEGIGIVEQVLGGVPQIAVFDTAFHRSLPEAAAIYPGPYDWVAEGIRRYGFHGINHQYCAERARRLLASERSPFRLVTCHLGNGCSLAAVRDGRSVDTTMGFTPLEGLMMGTRSGSVDPAILTFLMRQNHSSAEQLDDLLNKKSGLAGISGNSNDMREIVSAMKAGNSRARLAFDIFIHRLKSLIGSMIAVLGGVDALVFTAGIGENSAEVRAAACANFDFLGLRLDASRNSQAASDADISVSDSRVRVLVIRAQEDWAIACACWKLAKIPSR